MNKRILWKKIKKRGAILPSNARSIMRDAGNLYRINDEGELTDESVGTMPNTYLFNGCTPYYSFSASYPTGSKKDPYVFSYFQFDEDEGCSDEWMGEEIRNPLEWQTENEFLEKIGEKPNE
ncbi:hypothetical protein [Enterococcus caccae]|nr:hypothetical protein [Enterococcus caccae]